MVRQLLLSVAILTTSPVIASNYNFLEDAPISHFTKEDTRLFEESIQSALNTKKDSEKLAWKNEKSGTSGLLQPLSTFTEKDTQCRKLRIVNRANNKIGESLFKFCKTDGTWIAVKMLEKNK